MAAGTVRIRGLRETVVAFKRLDAGLPTVVTDELKKAAEPVAAEARATIGRYRGAKTETIKTRAKGRGDVFVTQGARKKTGLRGDFGALQMRHLMDALDSHQHEIYAGVEHALDEITRSF